MNNFLSDIIRAKEINVEQRKHSRPLPLLMNQCSNNESGGHSLVAALNKESGPGIIAEFKRRSPSNGNLNIYADVTEITRSYVAAGATALSILTEECFFNGCDADLLSARQINNCPILRKDFIIDTYQIYESKYLGADVILLIAAILTPAETLLLTTIAKFIGLEVLLEIHSEDEIGHLNPLIDIVGINNRNLHDFTTSIQTSLMLYDKLPSPLLKISESGIDDPLKYQLLRNKGFDGFLIGEFFMKSADPGDSLKSFIENIQQQV